MSAAVNHEGWFALAGALMGGSGLKIIEAWLRRPKDAADELTEFRQELRQEIKDLRVELARVEAELDNWKGKYYALADEFRQFKDTHS